MARPRGDGTPSRAVHRRKLTDMLVTSRRGGDRDQMIWDVKQPGLALSVRTTGKKAWKVFYRFHGRPRWLHLGDARSIGLADARRLTARISPTSGRRRSPSSSGRTTNVRKRCTRAR